jgi:lipid II:glycine glycyltransferase (peptidoglycan interpeptide bridge formation enzyme)
VRPPSPTNLRPPEAAILAQMKQKGRYNVRVAQRHGVTVVEDASNAGLADFLRIYEDTAGRQALKPKPPAPGHILLRRVPGP